MAKQRSAGTRHCAVPELAGDRSPGASIRFGVGSDLSEYNTFPLGCLQNGAGPAGRPEAQCRTDASGNFFFGNNAQGNGYNPLSGRSFPNYQYDSNNVFTNGYITCRAAAGEQSSSGSSTTRSHRRQPAVAGRPAGQREERRSGHVAELKFSPTPHWDINLDAQYVKSRHDDLDMEISGSNFADHQMDLTGKFPVIVPHSRTHLAQPGQRRPGDGRRANAQYFADPVHVLAQRDGPHRREPRAINGRSQGDVAYNFLNDSFLKQLKFGARYADREQDIKYTTYNWGSLSEVWVGQPGGGGASSSNQVGVPGGRPSSLQMERFLQG